MAWKKSVKLVAAIFPPVDLFEEVADPADLDAVLELRSRTDPTRREVIQSLLIPAEDRVVGPGSGYVMARFVHISPTGTRFGPPAMSAAPFGVYYAARDEATAIAEVKHHRVEFLSATSAPAQDLDFAVLNAPIKGARFYDLRDRQKEFRDVYSPTSYTGSQKLGAQLRQKGADGIVYDSVRREGGECVAVFRPRCVGPCRAVKQLIFRWDGAVVEAVMETHRIA
ncbi:MAG: RES family NAD+ phosphorylase [Gemmatimonadaceae bacterium]